MPSDVIWTVVKSWTSANHVHYCMWWKQESRYEGEQQTDPSRCCSAGRSHVHFCHSPLSSKTDVPRTGLSSPALWRGRYEYNCICLSHKLIVQRLCMFLRLVQESFYSACSDEKPNTSCYSTGIHTQPVVLQCCRVITKINPNIIHYCC